MRKLLLGFAGVSALALGSAANATLIVTTSTQVSAITGPNSPDGGLHYTFAYTSTCGSVGVPPASAVTCGPTYSSFEATVSFVNDVGGFYGLGIQNTATTVEGGAIDPDTDVDFSNAFLSYSDGTFIAALTAAASNNDVHESFSLSGLELGPNPLGLSYVLHVTGNRGIASSFDGNLNFVAGNAVPEPATWAMMLIGFGAIGWQLRRRRAHLGVAI